MEQPDLRALVVAQVLQEQLPDAGVVLFGSRAVGSGTLGPTLTWR